MSSKTIKIAILDDHQIVIDGLKLLLGAVSRFNLVYDCNSGKEMIRYIQKNEVDILLTDIMMPEMNGYDVAKELKAVKPELKILALSMNGEGDLAHKLIEEIKVEGYILKTTDRQELIDAIEKVYQGNNYYSKDILTELQGFKKILKENDQLNLTSREIEIIKCIAENLSNKQIAETLFISERTVETHRKNIFRKTDTHNATSLIEFVRKRKLID